MAVYCCMQQHVITLYRNQSKVLDIYPLVDNGNVTYFGKAVLDYAIKYCVSC